jgi:acyl-CoA synthetase (AMP-forming)/AMP-acid ligase II
MPQVKLVRDTDRSVSPPRTKLTTSFRRASRLYPNCIALDLHDRQVTYREFYQTVENTARKLATLGALKGDRVAVLMQNSPE